MVVWKRGLLPLMGRIALVFFGLCVGLVLLEGTFRALYPDPSPKLVNQALQFHEQFGLAFTPNTEGWNTSLRGEYSTYITINGKGLRGREYSYDRTMDTFRILILGDSFTAGLQVPEAETFPKLLEAQLQQRYPQVKIEVVNAGVIGYGTDNQLAYYTQEGYKYRPDLVILAFFSGNDFTDNIWYSLYELEDGALVAVPPTEREGGIVQSWSQEESVVKRFRQILYTNSRLYSVSIELVTISAIQRVPAVVDLMVSLGFVEITRPNVNYGNFYVFRYLPEAAWIKVDALINQLNQEIKARDGQLLVAILPDETDVDEARRAEILEAYAHLTIEETVTGPPPGLRLGQILREKNISNLDLLESFKDYRQKADEPLYFRYDGHWTPAGHRLVSQAIFNFLIKDELVISK